MARLTARFSGRLYPRIPFLNGFCLLVRSAVIEQIGLFDEETFGDGYGEENDYCIRARQAGWQLAVADDAYVYHAQSRSYSHERRRALVKRADDALLAKHDGHAINRDVIACRFDRVLQGMRARARMAPRRQRWIAEGRERFEGRRVLFVLYDAAPSGGGRVVLQEARAMLEMGVHARVVNLTRFKEAFERSYPENTVPVLYVEREGDIHGLLRDQDAAIGTLYASVEHIAPLSPDGTGPVKGYYVQDFEPRFFKKDSREYRSAWRSYTQYPDLVQFTKTDWNRDALREILNLDPAVVGPSVDIDVFRPRARRDGDWPNRPLRIAAMIRPATPRRQAKLTMEILRGLWRAHGDTIAIDLFGCWPDDHDFLQLPRDFPWRHGGILNRDQLATFFNEIDVFVDFSAWQAMGLSAMEAMACGAAVLVPREGGAGSFAKDEDNALFVDTHSPEACAEALERIVMYEPLRRHLQHQAIADICEFPPERAALGILRALLSETAAREAQGVR